MKMLFILLAILCVGSFELVNASDGDKIQLIKLVSGESIKGKVSGVKDGEVAVITDYGVMRVPVEKLTAESKSSLGLELGKGGEQNVDVAQLKERILDLEKLVARLRVENAELRRQGVAASSPVADNKQIQVEAGEKIVPKQPGGADEFWISSSGKRHNSRCRYFNTGKGKSGTSDEGVACKVCGG